jgi:rsbT co-antagonist protein RsbR
MLDLSLNETLFAFERLSDQIEQETQKEMAELSAPVVPIKEGVAVLPLIGSLDSYRAHYILENVIPRIAEEKVNYLIADFSGLHNIDLDIARYLFQIENVLRLLGITTIITGLRPKLAQTAVLGGIDLTSLKTFATVKQAVENID